MTYDDFILRSAPIPKEQHSVLNIRHDTKTGWYRIFGIWHGAEINVTARTYKQAAETIREQHNVCIPARKDLIFCHTWKGRKHALLQGFLPGSAVVDVSAWCVK